MGYEKATIRRKQLFNGHEWSIRARAINSNIYILQTRHLYLI